MMVLTRTLSFQILLVACLIGSLSALRFPSTYRTRKSSLSMISNKDLGAATITFSLFLSPAFATTTMNAASTTFGSNTYYSPPAVVKSTENGDKVSNSTVIFININIIIYSSLYLNILESITSKLRHSEQKSRLCLNFAHPKSWHFTTFNKSSLL